MDPRTCLALGGGGPRIALCLGGSPVSTISSVIRTAAEWRVLALPLTSRLVGATRCAPMSLTCTTFVSSGVTHKPPDIAYVNFSFKANDLPFEPS